MADPLEALRKATSIGPPTGPETPLRTPRQQQDPFMQLLEVSGMSNPIEQAEGPMQAVARGGPQAIAGLKAAGRTMLDRIKGERAFAPSHTTNIQDKVTRQRVLNALEFAQQRYPRLFGHLTSIGPVPPHRVAQGRAGEIVLGDAPKEAALNLDPNLLGMEGRGPTGFVVNPETSIGHELSHLANALTDPNMLEKYQFAQGLPGGYANSAQEYLANLTGERFAGRLKDWMSKTSGGGR